jgi:hypothetical protein
VAHVSYPRVFEIVDAITGIEHIARGSSVRATRWRRDQYGPGHWIKRKGAANVRLPDGTIRKAEVHWYEAHGIGKKTFKIKRWLD